MCRTVIHLFDIVIIALQDDVIRHLLMDVRRCGRHSELATKAERVIETSAIEDYDRPISPVTLQMIQGFEVRCIPSVHIL